MTRSYSIREGRESDIDALVDFTLQEARDAEGKDLDAASVTKGVREAFADPPRARDWVAEAPDGVLAASISVVTEWSNFRGGDYWWIQSLFIASDHRGSGLVDLLLDHVAGVAAASRALELRLYAHVANERALRVYRRCGFVTLPYVIMQRSVHQS